MYLILRLCDVAQWAHGHAAFCPISAKRRKIWDAGTRAIFDCVSSCVGRSKIDGAVDTRHRNAGCVSAMVHSSMRPCTGQVGHVAVDMIGSAIYPSTPC